LKYKSILINGKITVKFYKSKGFTPDQLYKDTVWKYAGQPYPGTIGAASRNIGGFLRKIKLKDVLPLHRTALISHTDKLLLLLFTRLSSLSNRASYPLSIRFSQPIAAAQTAIIPYSLISKIAQSLRLIGMMVAVI